MLLTNCLSGFRKSLATKPRATQPNKRSLRPQLESLEDRVLLSHNCGQSVCHYKVGPLPGSTSCAKVLYNSSNSSYDWVGGSFRATWNGNDGRPDTITMTDAGGVFKVFRTDPAGNNHLWQSWNVSDICSITYIGHSRDAENIVINLTGSLSSSVPILIRGRGGVNTLRVNGSSGADTMFVQSGVTVDLTTHSESADRIAVNGVNVFYNAQYTDFRGATVDGKGGGDTITVLSTAAVTPITVRGGDHNDTINVGDGNAGMIQGRLTVYGDGGAQDKLRINDQDLSSSQKQTYDIYGSSGLSRSGAAWISYRTTEGLEINAGRGADTFRVIGTYTPNVTINANSGWDTLQGPRAYTSTPHTWKITGVNKGALNGKVSFNSVENLTGDRDPDRFVFSNGARVSGRIDGGGNSDELDYRAYSTSVGVYLSTGQATGTGGYYGGVRNIENVTGGSGNDVIVGNDSANVLNGGSGRDLLVGGEGADRLYGNNGDDILIAGATAYDSSPYLFWQIMDEWKSSRSYDDRVRNIGNGVGWFGNIKLDQSTVFADSSSDSLYGQAGQDWFWSDPWKFIRSSSSYFGGYWVFDWLPDWDSRNEVRSFSS